MANQTIGLFASAVTGGRADAAAWFIHRLGTKHTAALKSTAYLEQPRALAASGEIRRLQRQVFDEIGRFVEVFPSWQIGILDRWVTEANRLNWST